MANWNLPTPASGYLDFVSEMNAKFVDAATFQAGAPVNLPVNTIRYNRSANIFEEWDAVVWVPKVIALAGGGTGANTAVQARTNLGLGSMATQNSNAVNITGGSITGVAYSGSDINTGVIALARGGTGASLSLGAVGTVLLSDGSGVVFAPGTSIAQLNAGALVVGTVPVGRLTGVAILAGVNVYTGENVFAGSTLDAMSIQGPQPFFNFKATSAPVGKKIIRFFDLNGDFRIQSVTDDYTAAVDTFLVTYEGVVTCYGSGILGINASNIASGTVNTARLGAGVANGGTFLRGDGQWAVPPTSAPGETIPSGLIALFATNCPAGWTRVAALDGRFPLGASGYGAVGGAPTHSHSFGLNTSADGGHDHSLNLNGSGHATGSVAGSTGGASIGVQTADAGGSFQTVGAHTHGLNIAVDLPVTVNTAGRVDAVGTHTHQVNGNTNDVNHMPSYLTVVYCQKN